MDSRMTAPKTPEAVGTVRPADVLALAVEPLVKPGGMARLLNKDNSADPAGWLPIEEAAASGRAFFVELKETLAAFDLDTPELVQSGESFEPVGEVHGAFGGRRFVRSRRAPTPLREVYPRWTLAR